jgi:hypothetical protein
MILGSRLREPDVTAVAIELAAGKSLGDVLLDDDGTTGSVDKPSTCVIVSIVKS